MLGNRYDIMKKTDEIRKLMVDEESKELYDARIDYFFDRDFYSYSDRVFELEHTWKIALLDRFFMNEIEVNRLIIWGCGKEGKYARRLIYKSEYKDMRILFCDNNQELWGSDIEIPIAGERVNTEVIAPQSIIPDDDVVIIANRINSTEIFEQLMNSMFPINRVIFPQGIYGHHLYGKTGEQYFDAFSSINDEVFLDCGCLNGSTSRDFVKWCNGNYKRIVAFEPNKAMIPKCREAFSEPIFHDVELIEKGTWSEPHKLRFSVNTGIHMGSAKINELGNQIIEVDSIDNILAGKEATFIKMDIEGSEAMSLIGAERTIKKYKPRLALSLYHKPEDVLEIPYIVNSFNPDYRFIIRQYASNMHETILYAVE